MDEFPKQEAKEIMEPEQGTLATFLERTTGN